MAGALFDANAYNLHPALWPSAGPDVMSDDEAAELLWPGVTQGDEGPAVVEEWNVPMWASDEVGVQSW